MLPLMFGIMIPIALGSAAIVSWAIASSKPAPDYVDADELLRLAPSPAPNADAVTHAETGLPIVRKRQKAG
jgi:hypothetical protein